MIYFCSDTQNYQLLNVKDNISNFNITIIVVGTGGTKQDDLSNLYNIINFCLIIILLSQN